MATTDRLLYIGSDGRVRQLGFDPAATDWAGGGGSSGGVTSASIPVTLACTANDLMIVQEDSAVRPALASAGGLSNEINTTAGPVASKSNSSMESGAAYYTLEARQTGMSVCELGDGGIAYGYTGNGTTATTGVRVRISSPSGANVTVVSLDTATTGCYGVRLTKLTTTTFLVAYCVSSTGQIKFTVLNNDGSTAVALAAVNNTIAGDYVTEWAVTALTGGGFVLLYTSGTNLVFGRYNNSAVLQGSVVTVQASASPMAHGLLPLANGGFWVVYQYSTTDYRFGRYNSTGTLQGALTTIVTGNNYLYYGVGPSDSLLELPNGNVVICGPSPGSRDPDIYVFSSSGSSIASIDLGTSTFRIGQRLGLARTTTGGFAVAGVPNGATGTTIATYTSDGAAAIGATSLDGTGQAVGAVAPGVGAIIRSLGAAGFAVSVCDVNSTGGRSARLFTVSTSLALTGTAVSFTNFSGGVNGLSAALTSGGRMATLFAYLSTPHTIYFSVYNVVRRSVLGVATTTTTAGSNATISFSGAYTLNQDLSPGGSFDHRTQAVPGCRGFVIKQSAVLLGVV